MPNLIKIVSTMIELFEKYNEEIKYNISNEDYNTACKEARYLLEDVLGEENVSDFELKYNSVELKKGLHALKRMSNQIDKKVMDEDLVKSCYNQFKESSKKFVKELFEFYINFENKN